MLHWTHPKFKYPEPSHAHKANMAQLLEKLTYTDYTAMMRAKDERIAYLEKLLYENGIDK